MSAYHKLQEETEHLKEIDARLQELERKIDWAHHIEEEALHPRSPLIDVPPQNLETTVRQG
jgi:hypothetical protein